MTNWWGDIEGFEPSKEQKKGTAPTTPAGWWSEIEGFSQAPLEPTPIPEAAPVAKPMAEPEPEPKGPSFMERAGSMVDRFDQVMTGFEENMKGFLRSLEEPETWKEFGKKLVTPPRPWEEVTQEILARPEFKGPQNQYPRDLRQLGEWVLWPSKMAQKGVDEAIYQLDKFRNPIEWAQQREAEAPAFTYDWFMKMAKDYPKVMAYDIPKAMLYDIPKSFTDPMLKYFQALQAGRQYGKDAPVPEEELMHDLALSAWLTVQGLGEFLGKPLGFYGWEAFKEHWDKNPGAALAGLGAFVSPIVRARTGRAPEPALRKGEVESHDLAIRQEGEARQRFEDLGRVHEEFVAKGVEDGILKAEEKFLGPDPEAIKIKEQLDAAMEQRQAQKAITPKDIKVLLKRERNFIRDMKEGGISPEETTRRIWNSAELEVGTKFEDVLGMVRAEYYKEAGKPASARDLKPTDLDALGVVRGEDLTPAEVLEMKGAVPRVIERRGPGRVPEEFTSLEDAADYGRQVAKGDIPQVPPEAGVKALELKLQRQLERNEQRPSKRLQKQIEFSKRALEEAGGDPLSIKWTKVEPPTVGGYRELRNGVLVTKEGTPFKTKAAANAARKKLRNESDLRYEVEKISDRKYALRPETPGEAREMALAEELIEKLEKDIPEYKGRRRTEEEQAALDLMDEVEMELGDYIKPSEGPEIGMEAHPFEQTLETTKQRTELFKTRMNSVAKEPETAVAFLINEANAWKYGLREIQIGEVSSTLKQIAMEAETFKAELPLPQDRLALKNKASEAYAWVEKERASRAAEGNAEIIEMNMGPNLGPAIAGMWGKWKNRGVKAQEFLDKLKPLFPNMSPTEFEVTKNALGRLPDALYASINKVGKWEDTIAIGHYGSVENFAAAAFEVALKKTRATVALRRPGKFYSAPGKYDMGFTPYAVFKTPFHELGHIVWNRYIRVTEAQTINNYHNIPELVEYMSDVYNTNMRPHPNEIFAEAFARKLVERSTDVPKDEFTRIFPKEIRDIADNVIDRIALDQPTKLYMGAPIDFLSRKRLKELAKKEREKVLEAKQKWLAKLKPGDLVLTRGFEYGGKVYAGAEGGLVDPMMDLLMNSGRGDKYPKDTSWYYDREVARDVQFNLIKKYGKDAGLEFMSAFEAIKQRGDTLPVFRALVVTQDKLGMNKDPTKLYSGLPLSESAKKVQEMYQSMRDAVKSPLASRVRNAGERARKAFVDTQGNLKNSIEAWTKSIGDSQLGNYVNSRIILARGGGARAAEYMKVYGKTVYAGLDKKQRELLDQIIFSRRVIQLDKHEAERIAAGKKGRNIKHPGGLGAREHMEFLEGLKQELGEAQYDVLWARANNYFAAMREQLELLREEGIISDKAYNVLSRFEYQPRRNVLNALDPVVHLGKFKTKLEVRDSGVESLKAGEVTDILETDSKLLLEDRVARTQGRIYRNRANVAMAELAKTYPDNPFIREKKPNEYWETVKFYEDGKLKKYYMPRQWAKEWLLRETDITYTAAQWMRILSGSALLRPMATGINPGFAFTNFLRDAAHFWAVGNYMDAKGKWRSVYNPVMAPFQMGRDMSRVFTDVATRSGKYADMVEDGMGMEFLTQQGTVLEHRMGKRRPLEGAQNALGYLNMTSELLMRAAFRERAIDRIARREGLTKEQIHSDPQYRRFREEASAIARDYLDFSQGGTQTKLFDSGVPYLNAAAQATRGIFRTASRNPKGAVAKAGILGATAMSMYLAQRQMAPEALEQISQDELRRNWVFFPFGDWAFIDKDGQKRYVYLKFPKDQGQQFFSTAAEFITRKALGDKVPEPTQIVETLKELAPADTTSLPPTISALLTYFLNVDTWSAERVWKGPDVEAGQEYWPDTPAYAKKVGQVTGLSPERLNAALQEVFTRGNAYTYPMGWASEKLMSDMPEDTRQEHIAMWLSQAPIAKRFIGVTHPYGRYREQVKDISQDVETRRFVAERTFDVMLRAHFDYGNMDREELKKFLKSQDDPGTVARLVDRMKFFIKVKGLEERSFWLKLHSLNPEARAKVFYNVMSEADEERKNLLKQEAAKVPGIFTDDFKRYLRQLVSESQP